MHQPRTSVRVLVAMFCGAACVATVDSQTDLDAFMRQVVAKRDDNWKKLQQHILDERETVDVRGPGRVPLWGERRDYTWYIRDGFFVRSPVKVNRVAISEGERRAFEADYLKRVQEREKRGQRGQVSISPSGVRAQPGDEGPAVPVDAAVPTNVDSLLKQTRQPQFISSAYFLRFKFDEGKYALVGKETLDGHEVVRIEYYPSKLFGGTDRRRNKEGTSERDKAYDAAFQRLMNKVALVTLWVEPNAHQIVKYTFDNVAFDFLPAQWFVHIDDLEASMTMGQPFADLKDVWLPRDMEMLVGLTLAVGQFQLRYTLGYSDYRRPDVSTRVGIKER